MDKASLLKKKRTYGIAFWVMLLAAYGSHNAIANSGGGFSGGEASVLIAIRAIASVGWIACAVMWFRIRKKLQRV